jgi:hypothetical protein
MQHALTWLRDHDQYTPDWVMILLPTSPLRQPFHIREAVALAVASGADSVVSVDELPPHFNPMRVVTIDDDGWARLFVGGQPVKRRPGRRQDMPKAWVLNGAVYLFRTEVLFDATEPSLYGDKVAALDPFRPTTVYRRPGGLDRRARSNGVAAGLTPSRKHTSLWDHSRQQRRQYAAAGVLARVPPTSATHGSCSCRARRRSTFTEFAHPRVAFEPLPPHVPTGVERRLLGIIQARYLEARTTETLRIKLAAGPASTALRHRRLKALIGRALAPRADSGRWYHFADRLVSDPHADGVVARHRPTLVAVSTPGLISRSSRPPGGGAGRCRYGGGPRLTI